MHIWLHYYVLIMFIMVYISDKSLCTAKLHYKVQTFLSEHESHAVRHASYYATLYEACLNVLDSCLFCKRKFFSLFLHKKVEDAEPKI